MVLVYDVKRSIDLSAEAKLDYRWLGPYRVSEAIQDKGYYRLQELDGVELRGTFAANRLKRFYRRDQTLFPLDPDPEHSQSDSDSGSGDDYEPNDEEGKGYSEPLAIPKPSLVPQVIITPLSEGQKALYRKIQE